MRPAKAQALVTNAWVFCRTLCYIYNNNYYFFFS